MSRWNSETRRTGIFSPFCVGALALGCCVGWGAFIMPDTTFLPVAGPLGAPLALGLGALAMLIIAANYHFMMVKRPGTGGPWSYLTASMGHDHALLCVWYLWLVYVALIWANVTAFPLIIKNFLGPILKLGFSYYVAGSEIYLGEVFFCMGLLCLFALLCIFRLRLSVLVNAILALLLFVGSLLCFSSVLTEINFSTLFTPPFADKGTPIQQVSAIALIAPWAFVGFEAISHVSGEFSFPRSLSFPLMAAAIFSSVLVYACTIWLAVTALPPGYVNWQTYLADLKNLTGLASMPIFYAIESCLGSYGLGLLAVTIVGALSTSLFGFYIVVSRLTHALASEEVLPGIFARRSNEGSPWMAVLLVLVVSIFIPFFGRTVIGWVIDIASVGATMAYCYTSLVTLKEARREGRLLYMLTGGAGVLLSAAFCLLLLLPELIGVGSLSSSSFLILTIWSVFGLLFLLYMKMHDQKKRFGRSGAVLCIFLFLIAFSSYMWMRELVPGISLGS